MYMYHIAVPLEQLYRYIYEKNANMIQVPDTSTPVHSTGRYLYRTRGEVHVLGAQHNVVLVFRGKPSTFLVAIVNTGTG